MCTYLTEKVSITGSGKGPSGWFTVTDASVYFDHPVHAPAEHTLNIDFLDPGAGPSARVAVELTADSARALVKAIQATLDAAPPGLAPNHLAHLVPPTAARGNVSAHANMRMKADGSPGWRRQECGSWWSAMRWLRRSPG